MAQKKPENVFRIGFVSASIFAHDIESEDSKRTIRSVSVQKRYLNGEIRRFSFGSQTYSSENAQMATASSEGRDSRR